ATSVERPRRPYARAALLAQAILDVVALLFVVPARPCARDAVFRRVVVVRDRGVVRAVGSDTERGFATRFVRRRFRAGDARCDEWQPAQRTTDHASSTAASAAPRRSF